MTLTSELNLSVKNFFRFFFLPCSKKIPILIKRSFYRRPCYTSRPLQGKPSQAPRLKTSPSN